MPRPARRGLAATLALTGLLLPLAATPTAASAATAGSQPAPARLVSGWLPYWGMPAAYRSSTRHADLVRDAMPFWYGATGTTRIEANQGAGNRSVVAGLRSGGVKVLPTVTDEAGTATMLRIMTSRSRRAAHRHRLVRLVMDHHYNGVNLDYESMAWNVSTWRQATRLRNGFTTFVHGLAAALHRRSKLLSIAVIAKTAGSTSKAGAVFDYRGLGHSVNRFQVMSYDYHWSGGSPGAVAPYDWQSRVMAYTTSLVNPRKVELGIPSYGYDWGRKGHQANSVTYADAMRIARAHGKRIQWSTSAKSPYFTYRKDGVHHEVWFTNAHAVAARLPLVTRYRLGGIAEWAFGYEDPAQWSRIRTFATSS